MPYSQLTYDETLSQSSGGEAEPIPESLWEWLSTEARKNLDGTALIASHQSANLLRNIVPKTQHGAAYLSWSYSQLLTAVDRLAYFFDKQKVVAEDAIYAFVDNSNVAEWTLLFWTAARLGLVLVSLDPGTLERPEEVESLIKSLKPAVVVTRSFSLAKAFDEFKALSPKLKLLCSDERRDDSWQSLGQLQVEADVSLGPGRRSDPGETALVMCTSGSTSLPKGCPVSVRGLIAQTRQYHSLYRVDLSRETRHLVTTLTFRPICYLSCLNTWAVGGTAIFCGKDFDPARTFRALRDLEVTHAWFVPAMVHLMYKQFSEKKLDERATQAVKVVMMSADVADRDVVTAAREMFPPDRTRLVPHWGMSEGAPLFGFVDEEAEKLKFDESTGVAGVGKALPGTSVKICETGTTNRVVKRGKQGELHVSSIATIDHYLGGRAADDFYQDEAGTWFKTGDTAVMDQTGVIFIAGRTKDIVVVNGRSIIPSVLEGCLKEGFGVSAIVAGVKDEAHGNVAAAVVKYLPQGQSSKREMEEYVRQQQGEDQALKGGVWCLEELGMDDWPYNSSGKIQKKELKNAIELERDSGEGTRK
jgi:acyl-CoA synthetase (AMP-forming)/AMP-acid ligase II